MSDSTLDKFFALEIPMRRRTGVVQPDIVAPGGPLVRAVDKGWRVLQNGLGCPLEMG